MTRKRQVHPSQRERVYFHPRVRAWLDLFGFDHVWHEPYIGMKKPDFIVQHEDRFAIIECKVSAIEKDLPDYIHQVKGYIREIDHRLSSNYGRRWTAKKYEGKFVLPCLAIGSLCRISFDDAFCICANQGVLLLNPGYKQFINWQNKPLNNWDAQYPMVINQWSLFDDHPVKQYAIYSSKETA